MSTTNDERLEIAREVPHVEVKAVVEMIHARQNLASALVFGLLVGCVGIATWDPSIRTREP